MHTLQEHLLQVRDLEIEGGSGLPQNLNVDSIVNIGGGGDELHYIKGKKGKKGRRKNSAGY